MFKTPRPLNLEMMWFRRSILAALTTGSLVLSSCAGGRNGNYLKDRVGDLVDRTVPGQAKEISRTAVHDEHWAQGAAWEFDLEEGATEYTQWVEKRMTTDFTMLPSSATKLIFSKTVAGDATSVVTEITRKAGGIHVTVSVNASPD